MEFEERRSDRQRIVVVGPHVMAGPSMHRYTSCLTDMYALLGVDFEVLSPGSFFTKLLLRFSGFVNLAPKWPMYLDKLAFMLLRLPLLSFDKSKTLHIADQGDAVYIAFMRWQRRRHSTMVTVHDVIAIQAARGLVAEQPIGLLGRLYQRFVCVGLRNADVLLAVSLQTKNDLIETVDPLGIVRLLPVPVSEAFTQHRADDGAMGYKVAQKRKRFLIVASASFRKRRLAGIAMFLKMATVGSGEYELIVVGSDFSNEELSLMRPETESLITRVGRISDEELVHLYQSAVAIIVMSKFEGFCWPIVEANACGTVAICALEPILRETGGRANIFCEPGSAGPSEAELAKISVSALRANADRFGLKTVAITLREVVAQLPLH